jgi:Tol biopolymer transport system component
MTASRLRVGVLLALPVVGLLALPGETQADGIASGFTEVVSVDTAGGPPSNDVSVDDVSPNGRFVLFTTDANDIIVGDTGGHYDVFLVDRLLGTTERVSVSSSEAAGNADSYNSTVSDDGERVVFSSEADNLVAGDSNGDVDIFLRNRAAGTTSRLSVTAGGAQVEGNSHRAQISGNGAVVAFQSNGDALVPGDAGDLDIFTKTISGGAVELVSQSTLGAQGVGLSQIASISHDGRYVAFQSEAANLVLAVDTNGVNDIFVRDRTADVTTRVSVSPTLVQANNSSWEPAISADGRWVAYSSFADNLLPGEVGDLNLDVFVHDRTDGSLERASITSGGVKGNGNSGAVSISADGDRVAFSSFATNLGAPGSVSAVFVRDVSDFSTTRIPANPGGSDGGAFPKISPDGRYVVWDDTNIGVFDGDGRTYLRILAGDTFTDVPTLHGFFEEISWLVDSEVTTGFADDTYRPTIPVSRQGMAAFLRRYLGGPFTPPATPTFTDVPTSHTFFADIEWAADQGYVGGFPDGSFRPTAPVSRQSMAVMLYRAAEVSGFTPPPVPTFDDVGAGHPFRTEIEWLASTGITGGYADGGFHPTEAVTRQSTAAFLYRYELVIET